MKTIDLDILNETQKIAAKRAIQTALRIGVISITFKKTDGEIRDMMATLNPDALTQVGIKLKPEFVSTVENLNTITVVDFQKKEWRSFRMDRLVSIGAISAHDLIVPVTSSL